MSGSEAQAIEAAASAALEAAEAALASGATADISDLAVQRLLIFLAVHRHERCYRDGRRNHRDRSVARGGIEHLRSIHVGEPAAAG
jgi:hypothetical protein